MKSEPQYDSEAAMCSAFTIWAQQQGWIVYPETAGWDMLLVNRANQSQIGVQAKLRFNSTLIRQVLPGAGMWANVEYGPDCRAILLPKHDREVDDAMRTLGVISFSSMSGGGFRPKIEGAVDFYGQWPADQRHPLPKHVPDVVAGASGPIQLTDWKVKALRLTAVLEVRGHLTRQDFRDVGVDFRRWPASEWLIAGDEGRYVRGPKLNVDRQHPTVFAEIRAEVLADHGTLPDAGRKDEA